MCPYETWQRGTFVFCEAHRCSLISEPINTFSNLGFVVVGIWVLKKFRRVPQVRLIGVASLLVGILSGFYHATSSYFGEVLDLGSMYLLVGGLIAFNLQRLDVIRVKTSEGLALALSVVGMIVLFSIHGLGRPLFDGMVLSAISLELLIYLRERKHGLTYRYLFFWLALGCHLSAFGIWTLDSKKIVCFPESWFQGHAVWHLMGACTFIFLTKFYLQFWKHSEAMAKRR